MARITLRVKKLREYAKLPTYKRAGDAGMDVYACENVVIKPGQRVLIGTGIAAEFPDGFVALVWDKSGLAANRGLKTLAGVIDCGYRGEWKIAMLNTSDKDCLLAIGDQIAQVLIQPVIHANIEPVDELRNSDREDEAFDT